MANAYYSNESSFTQITPAWLGAAAASHTHNYAGSSSAGRTANSAIQLSYGNVKYVTKGSVDKPYWRFASFSSGGDWVDASMICVIDSGYDSGGFGIFKISVRNDQISTSGTQYAKIAWLVRQGFAANQIFAKTYTKTKTTCYTDIYFKANGTYNGCNIRVINSGARGSNGQPFAMLSEEPRAAADARTYTNTYEGYDSGTVSYANSAGSVAWSNVSGKPSTFAPSSHTHNYAGSPSAGGSATSAVKLDTSAAGSSTQPVYFSGGKPVACSYTIGKSVPSNAVFTDTNTWRGIQNNLTSTSTSDSLAANQGKVLNDKINNTIIVSSTQPTSSDCKIWIKV